MLACFPTEDWLPGSLTVLSWEHRRHHADNQSNSKGQRCTCFVNSVNISLLLVFPQLIFSFFFVFLPIFLIYFSQDLSSPNQYDTGVALTGLSCFVTPDLARDLANDIMTLVSKSWGVPTWLLLFSLFLFLLVTIYFSQISCHSRVVVFTSLKMCIYCLLLQMSHTKPYIRKKAVLIMYKVFLKYPESLRPAFPRLKEKLEDPDPGIRKHSIYPVC